MERRHYVITYDISDDKRRDTVYHILLGHGDWAQFSVFFCELSDRELVELRTRLRAAIHMQQDQILIVDLGRAARPLQMGLECVGRPYQPTTRVIVV